MENKEDRPAKEEIDMLERMIRGQSDDHRKDPDKAGNPKQDNKPGKSGPRAAVLSLVAVAWVLAGVPGHAGTIQVTTTGMTVDVAGTARIPEDENESTGLYVAETLTIDDLPGADGLVSLREAIIAANNTPGGPHTIVLEAGAVYTLTGPDNWWYGPTGLPPITSEIVIEGNGAIIERSDAPDTPRFRLFFINGSFHGGADGKVAVGAGELTLRELTLRNGLARGGNGGQSSLDETAATGSGGGGLGAGGAVFNQGRLRLEAVTLTGNSAAGGSAFGLGNASFTAGGSGGGIGGDSGDSGFPGGGFRGAGFEREFSTSSAFGGNGSTSGGGGGFRDIDNASGGTGVNGGGSGSLNTGGGFGYNTGYLHADGSGGGVGAGSNGSFNLHAGSGGFGGGGGGTGGWNKSGGDGGFGGGGGGGGEKFNEPDPGVGPGGAGGFGGGVGSSGCCTVGRGGGGGAGMGGAIFNHTGTLVVLNSTLTGNSATGGDSSNAVSGGGFGGAIFNLNGEISIIGSTLAGNGIAPGSSGLVGGGGVYSDSSGGAVYSRAQSGPGVQDAPVSSSVTLINSILAGSDFGALSAGDFGSWASADSSDDASIVQSGWNGSGSPLAIDPQLESPADNGGPTWTMMPQAGSPAIDAGACDPALVVDQRGIPRPQGGDCDIGAVEWIRAGLTVQVSGQGSVDAGPGPEPASGGIENCDETGAGQPHCAAEYVEGGTENVTLILAPGEHRHIDTANGCGGELDGDTFTIAWLNAGCTVAVVFALDQYTLEYSAGPGGSIDGETSQMVDHGSDGSTVTAVPDAGRHFVQWSDGVNDNPRIDTNVTANLSATAEFAPSVDGIFEDRFQNE